jgi:hypothetical protein
MMARLLEEMETGQEEIEACQDKADAKAKACQDQLNRT